MKRALFVLMVLIASVFAVASVNPIEITDPVLGPVQTLSTGVPSAPNKKTLTPTAMAVTSIKVLGYPTGVEAGVGVDAVAKSESLTTATAGETVSPEIVTSVKAISIVPVRASIIAETQTASGTVFKEIPPTEVSAVSYKNISIRPAFSEQKVVMVEGDVTVETANAVEVNEALYIKTPTSKEKVTISPVQAQAIIVDKAKVSPTTAVKVEENDSLTAQAGIAPTKISAISTISLEVENGKPMYVATATKKGKFLFVFPVEYAVKVKVDAQTGATAVDKPVWSALVVD